MSEPVYTSRIRIERVKGPIRHAFVEPFREPIERFEAALNKTPERIALREIGETFVLPA